MKESDEVISLFFLTHIPYPLSLHPISIPLSLSSFSSALSISLFFSQAQQQKATTSPHTNVSVTCSISATKHVVSRLLHNPCFMFVTFAMTMEGMFLAGVATFLPKYVANEYGIKASSASIYAGRYLKPDLPNMMKFRNSL